MYCKMCGTEINSTDLYCKVCGTKIESMESQTLSNSSEPKHEEFAWNIYEFPKPRKTEDINFQWDLNDLDKKDTEKEQILTDDNTKEDTEIIEEEIRKDEVEKVAWEIPQKVVSEEITVSSFEDLPGAILEDKTSMDDTTKINLEDTKEIDAVNDMDKFFTFSKKNEEFQQLLDREYEKIQKKSMERPSLKENQMSNLMSDLESSKEMEHSSIPLANQEEPEEIFDSEISAKLTEHANHLDEMMAARASFFTEAPEAIDSKAMPEEKMQEQIQLSCSPTMNETVVGPNTEVLVTVEVKANGKSETVTRQTISMEPAKISKALEKSEEILATPLKQEEILVTPLKQEEIVQDKISEEIQVEKSQEIQDKKTEEIQVESEEIQKESEDIQEKEQIKEGQKTSDLGTTLSQDDLTEFWKKNTFGVEAEKKKIKINGAKIALGIIAMILMIEIVALGVQFFFPTSVAAQKIYKTQLKIVKVFDGAIDDISGMFKTEKKNPKQEEPQNIDNETNQVDTEKEEEEAPNPQPMSDKTALIESQTYRNKNIQMISKADALVFDESHNYGINDLNQSTPIENNIWYTDENGKTVYYDQAVVGTLIAFNSQWIDYVNNKDKAILYLLKPNSKAYNKVSSFSKVGKLSEIFDSFSIGEIRKGSVGFYVFTEEKIKVTENGKERIVLNDWVYYLEPIDNKMMIVNYL